MSTFRSRDNTIWMHDIELLLKINILMSLCRWFFIFQKKFWSETWTIRKVSSQCIFQYFILAMNTFGSRDITIWMHEIEVLPRINIWCCYFLSWKCRHRVVSPDPPKQHVVRWHGDMSWKCRGCRPDMSSNYVAWTMPDDVTCRVGATSADMSADSFGHKEDVASSKTCRPVADMLAYIFWR